MAIAVLFSVCVMSAGFATLRALGLAKGALSIGLAPPIGLAVLAIISTWTVVLGLPPPAPGAAVLGVTLLGGALALSERQVIWEVLQTLFGEQRLSVALLLAAVATPMIVMGLAFAGVDVPLSPHDGAAHTEAIQADRLGQAVLAWYPPGLTALFAAFLELFGWLDSARGAFELGTSLPILAAIALFGLGVAVWGDLRVAATGALLLSSTYLYPYFPELWSGWPLAASLVLVMGMWAIALEYLKRPSRRWGALAGLVLGGVVVVHGTELYTLALVLSVVLLGAWRRVAWRVLAGDLGLAAAVALVSAAVYLPALLHWAGAGGAYAVGLEDGQVPQTAGSSTASVSASAGADPFLVFALGSLGIDLPLRLVLLGLGAAWACARGRGRSVIVIGLLFAALATLFSVFSGVPIVHQVYAAVFPWGMHYRLFMLVAIVQALLAGAGSVVALRWVVGVARRPGPTPRRLGRVARLLAATWVVLLAWGMTVFMTYPTSLVLGYSTDDDTAMGWLRTHAASGEMLINDGYADAGIWAPYKAGVPVLLPRFASEAVQRRAIVVDNVARLDRTPDAAAIVCALHASYVYRGARASEWDARRFPALAELRASPVLEEVFSSGGATIFRTRLVCPAR